MALWKANCWINLISIWDRRGDSTDKEQEIKAVCLNFLRHVTPHWCSRKEHEGHATVTQHGFPNSPNTCVLFTLLSSMSPLHVSVSFDPYCYTVTCRLLCNLLWLVLVFKFCLPNWIACETEAEILSPPFVSSSRFRSWLWMRWAFSKCQRNGQLRFSSLLCLLRKGNSELDSEFQQIWPVGHRQVSSLKASHYSKPKQGSSLTWAEKSYTGFLIRVTLLFHVSGLTYCYCCFYYSTQGHPVSFFLYKTWLFMYLFVCLCLLPHAC